MEFFFFFLLEFFSLKLSLLFVLNFFLILNFLLRFVFYQHQFINHQGHLKQSDILEPKKMVFLLNFHSFLNYLKGFIYF